MEAVSEETQEQDFNIRQASEEEAQEAVATSGASRTSKYEPVAKAWENSDEAVVLEDVSENDVQNIRNLIYRRFDKEDVIVRSRKNGEDSFNVSIMEREGDEYLRGSDGESENTAEDVTEGETSEDTQKSGGEDTDFEPSFE